MCVISVVVAQINFTTMDRVCGKIDNLPQSVFRGPSRLRICPRAELPPTKMVGDWPKDRWEVGF